MKRPILSILSTLLLLIPVNMIAQKVTHELGVVTGVNYYIWTNNEYEGLPKSQVGSVFGLAYQARLTKHFSLKTDVIYKKLGSTKQSGIYPQPLGLPSEISGTVTEKNDCLFVPILASWSFGKKSKIFVNTGPSLNVVFNEKTTYDYETYKMYHSRDAYWTSIMWTLGIGYSTPIGDKLVLNGELMSSVSNPYPSNSNYYIREIQSMLLVSVSYKLGSGKKE